MDNREDDVFFEIIRMNDEKEEDLSKEEYEELYEKLEAMRPLLDGDQLKKLDKILDTLGEK